jgi:hypothetical protein
MKDMTDRIFIQAMKVMPLENINIIDSPAGLLNFNFPPNSKLRVLDLQV